MCWNICKFGDSYFKQLIGTAMGTSCAVFFANLYFGAQEKQNILPFFQDHLKKIFFYRRYVDDVFLIWTGTCDITWDELTLAFNDFGILKWECTQPKNSINFLDLTLTIKGNKIITKTYQKPNNPQHQHGAQNASSFASCAPITLIYNDPRLLAPVSTKFAPRIAR